MADAQLTIMKCCNRAKHTGKCAQYWHTRQRDEVRKRVANEREFNKQLLAAESKIEEARERGEEAVRDTAHAWANDLFVEPSGL